MKKLTKIEWRMIIDDIEYGNYINITPMKDFKDLKKARKRIEKDVREYFDLLGRAAAETAEIIITDGSVYQDLAAKMQNQLDSLNKSKK